MGIDPLIGSALIGAGGSLIGGLFGSDDKKKTSSTTQNTVSEPWKVQQPYLGLGFQDAAYQYGRSRGTPYYTGDLYANLDPRSIAGLEGLYGYAGGQGMADAARVSGVAPHLIDQYGNLISGSNRLSNFNPTDPTGANIDAAGRYAANPYMDGIIDAASRDVMRNLRENELPQLNRMASATGNINSNRTAIKDAILQRGAADRVGDISAGLRGDAYSRGLDLAERARVQNQSDYLNSISQGASLADRGLARGFDAINQGQALGYDAFGKQIGVGEAYQADQQGNLTEGYDKWFGQDQRAWDLLNRYNALVGGTNWGGSTSSTGTTSTPTSIGGWQGALQGAIGGATSALGLYNSFRNLNASSPAATGGYGSLSMYPSGNTF